MPSGFLATGGGAAGGAGALSAIVHAAVVVAAVVGLRGKAPPSSNAAADVDVVAIEPAVAEEQAPTTPPIVQADDRPHPPAPTTRSHEARPATRASEPITVSQAATSVVTVGGAPALRYAMTVNAVDGTESTSTSTARPRHGDAPSAPVSLGPARAHRIYSVDPKYTPEALAAGIQGDVGLEITVSETGAFVSARVTHALGYGLDEAAVAAVSQWRFEPYRDADGRPTPVRMPWPVQFRLR